MITTHDYSELRLNEAIRLAKESTNVEVIVGLTRHPNPMVRKKALVEMCPCRVRENIEKFWSRVFEMTADVDPMVRAQVLHTLCDGSPASLEHQVMNAVETFNHDPDTEIRRKAHKVITSYNKTGKWNIL